MVLEYNFVIFEFDFILDNFLLFIFIIYIKYVKYVNFYGIVGG